MRFIALQLRKYNLQQVDRSLNKPLPLSADRISHMANIHIPGTLFYLPIFFIEF